MYKFNEFNSKAELDNSLADTVAKLLQQAVEQKGKAFLAVSGGSTPKGFFTELSQKKLDWKHITVTLVDERWLEESHQDSNTNLVKSHLLVNAASDATFFSIAREQSLTDELVQLINDEAESNILPFDVAILGMGTDGHTASIFPCSEQVSEALNENYDKALLAVEPTTAPYQRISFSFNALKQSKHLFLHITSENKLDVMEKALLAKPIEMPIGAFLTQTDTQLQVYWAK